MTRPPLTVVARSESDPMRKFREAEAESQRFAQDVASGIEDAAMELGLRCLEAVGEAQVRSRLTPAQQDVFARWGRIISADVERLRAIGVRR